jgi:hypothetical protein
MNKLKKTAIALAAVATLAAPIIYLAPAEKPDVVLLVSARHHWSELEDKSKWTKEEAAEYMATPHKGAVEFIYPADKKLGWGMNLPAWVHILVKGVTVEEMEKYIEPLPDTTQLASLNAADIKERSYFFANTTIEAARTLNEDGKRLIMTLEELKTDVRKYVCVTSDSVSFEIGDNDPVDTIGGDND